MRFSTARRRHYPVPGVLRAGICLAEPPNVLVLQARFRFDAADGAEPITVAHVVWSDVRDPHPVVQPSFSLQQHPGPATVLVKLQYLVEMTAPHSFARLQALRSRFWSFIDVSANPTDPRAKGD